MIYHSIFLAVTLATLATAAPVDVHTTNAADDAKFTEYGTYGAYGSYGKYDNVVETAPPPPEAPVSNNFVAISTRSGDPNVHLRPLAASGQRIFIGQETSTYCPLADCNGYVNFTVLSARPNDENSSLGLFTGVPGGQAAYITNDGQLGYTQAHSGLVPDDSTSTRFLYKAGVGPNSVGSLDFNSGGWTACPVVDLSGVYQIYAMAAQGFSRTDCIGINIATVSYDGNPAFQYT